MVHPSEVVNWQRLFTRAGMRLTFQCREEQPSTDGPGEVFLRYEISPAQAGPNRAERRARERAHAP